MSDKNTDAQGELPPDQDCIVHIYPRDLERMANAETTATVFSVAVGNPDGEESIPLYTADQMQLAIAKIRATEGQAQTSAAIKTWRDHRNADRVRLRDANMDDRGLPIQSYMEKEIAELRAALADQLADSTAPAVAKSPAVEQVAARMPMLDQFSSFAEFAKAMDLYGSTLRSQQAVKSGSDA